MPNKKTKVPFRGTPEQEQELRTVIAELKDEGGALMPILQKAQGIYGVCLCGRSGQKFPVHRIQPDVQ